MTHDHDHGAHGPRNAGRAFALGIGLNLAFVLVEAVYGVLAHSMALLADAGHNLSDVLALTLAWGASTLAKRGPSERFTYGLRSSSILVALLNAALLFVVAGFFGEGGTAKLLILSQVVLSMQLSFAVFPLVQFTSEKAYYNIITPQKMRLVGRASVVASMDYPFADSDLRPWYRTWSIALGHGKMNFVEG